MKKTKIRRRGGDGMGDDALSNRLRHEAKHFDTGSTVGALIIEITGEGPRPWMIDTNTKTLALHRSNPVQDLPGPLGEKMVFIYQSDKHPDMPGWLVAVDREICIHEGLGDLLFITELDFTQNPGKVMDDITFVRSHWWLVSEGFSLSTANSDVQKLPATLYHRIADSLAYAA